MTERSDNRSTARPSSSFTEKVVYVNRSAKTTEKNRIFSFLVIVVVGDGKGRIGIGKGKALEIPSARSKAVRSAHKNLVRIPLKDGRTLHHDFKAKFGSSIMLLRSAPSGTGIIAGGAARSLFEVLGIKDVVAKSLRSTNPVNMLKAVMLALKSIKPPKYIAEKRNKRISELFNSAKVATKEDVISDAAATSNG